MKIADFQKQVVQLKSYGQNGYGEIFPVPSSPKGGERYDFPRDAELLSDGQVEDWFLFFAIVRILSLSAFPSPRTERFQVFTFTGKQSIL